MSTGYALGYRFGLTPWEKAGRDADMLHRNGRGAASVGAWAGWLGQSA